MSGWDVGEVRAECNGEESTIQVFGGTGMGGDGECYHTVELGIDDHYLYLTSRDARRLIGLIEGTIDAADEVLIRKGEQDPVEGESDNLTEDEAFQLERERYLKRRRVEEKVLQFSIDMTRYNRMVQGHEEGIVDKDRLDAFRRYMVQEYGEDFEKEAKE